ncbi:YecA family protein [Alkalihalobacterium elongatum]|uniref:YecA family protein n=1 Tax=Alkalihalobacterium elongatum TaxID=2675466 RepID=UPI001C1FF41D|nr:SEC-C metal-binding domain-containing protein [Alkalihalobacterium elongatum]
MERMDINLKDVVLPVLENEIPDQEQQKREQKLWKKTNLPCKLLDTLNSLTKNELDPIRKNLEVKNASSLKKGELATLLAEVVPSLFKEQLYMLDQEKYDLMKTIINNGGYISHPGLSLEKIETLKAQSLVFPGLQEKQKVLFIPVELADLFNNIDGDELERVIRRNTEWVKLTQGMLYYYGVLSEAALIDTIQRLTGQDIDPTEYQRIISFASDYYGQVHASAHGYHDHRVLDAQKLIDAQNDLKVDYFEFTKGQLLRSSGAAFVQKNSALNDLINLLVEHSEISVESDKLAAQIVYMINTEVQPAIIIEYLQSKVDLPVKIVQVLQDLLKEVKNQTRLWSLKGYTPNELMLPEEKSGKPIPPLTFPSVQTAQKEINIKNFKKIGRNAPCICGSGKKYKKCCMK